MKKWEINLILVLIILLVIATIIDLNVSFEEIFGFMLN
jgi:hypothetical protein